MSCDRKKSCHRRVCHTGSQVRAGAELDSGKLKGLKKGQTIDAYEINTYNNGEAPRTSPTHTSPPRGAGTGTGIGTGTGTEALARTQQRPRR